ncbi:MAG TPA: queuosine salvage family protein [Thermomicrobiales bacterium]|nr:queuosine salvage family protein [Thermomicrobiales bacterium]
MTNHAIIWPDALDQTGPDPLYVLRSTAAVMQFTRDVTIEPDAINAVADRLVARNVSPEWDATLHNPSWIVSGDIERLTMWVMVLDALNFCFWGQGSNPDIRWRVERDRTLLDGYVALVAALERGAREGERLDDPDRLAAMDRESIAHLLRPAPGQQEIPLLEERVRNIRELGRGLNALESDTPATELLRRANGSAIELIRDIVRLFPSFNDVVTWRRAETGLPGNEVRFYKRAQILVGDLSGALQGTPYGRFHDLGQLTAFADYKVPQVLHRLGILCYSNDLIARISRRERIPAGSAMEIEIRAATIWGCELLRQEMTRRGHVIAAHELDWLLWEQGQSLPKDALPYHLTPTIFY